MSFAPQSVNDNAGNCDHSLGKYLLARLHSVRFGSWRLNDIRPSQSSPFPRPRQKGNRTDDVSIFVSFSFCRFLPAAKQRVLMDWPSLPCFSFSLRVSLRCTHTSLPLRISARTSAGLRHSACRPDVAMVRCDDDVI